MVEYAEIIKDQLEPPSDYKSKVNRRLRRDTIADMYDE